MDRLWEEAKQLEAQGKLNMSPEQPRIVFLDAATYGDISLQEFTDKWDCTVYQVTSPPGNLPRLAGHSIAVTNKVVIDKPVLNSPKRAN